MLKNLELVKFTRAKERNQRVGDLLLDSDRLIFFDEVLDHAELVLGLVELLVKSFDLHLNLVRFVFELFLVDHLGLDPNHPLQDRV
jgi:hypothetical protein